MEENVKMICIVWFAFFIKFQLNRPHKILTTLIFEKYYLLLHFNIYIIL